MCIPDGMMPERAVDEFNAAHIGTSLTVYSGGRKHFMNASTTIQVMEQLYVAAFALQRAARGLTHADRGQLMADAFSGNFARSSGEHIARESFSTLTNCLLATKRPGGWSESGQPCDQMHHRLRAEFMKVDCDSMALHADLRKRPQFKDMAVRASGQLKYEAAKSTILTRTLNAWHAVSRAKTLQHLIAVGLCSDAAKHSTGNTLRFLNI